MNPHSAKNSQAGNILIYILGAIFLLGALTLMVKGSSTPGASIDEETLMIRVSEIQDYGRELEQAVAFVFQNGHSEADIRFSHPDADSAYGDITDTPTRQIFHRDGGGATYREPPANIQITPSQWIFNGNNFLNEIGTTCSAASCTDLIALLTNVNQEFCVFINEQNDIDNPSDSPPQDSGAADITTMFVGDYTFNAAINDIAVNLDAKMEGCFEGGGTPPAGTYHYYRVLLPR